MKTILVDGYNVIHSHPQFESSLNISLESARKALIQICDDYLTRNKDITRLYLVFDGRDEFLEYTPHTGHRISVLFSTTHEEADGKIIEMLQNRPHKSGEWWVVTRDNEILNNAKSMAAKFMTPLDFIAACTARKYHIPTLQTDVRVSHAAADQITEEYRRHLGI